MVPKECAFPLRCFCEIGYVAIVTEGLLVLIVSYSEAFFGLSNICIL